MQLGPIKACRQTAERILFGLFHETISSSCLLSKSSCSAEVCAHTVHISNNVTDANKLWAFLLKPKCFLVRNIFQSGLVQKVHLHIGGQRSWLDPILQCCDMLQCILYGAPSIEAAPAFEQLFRQHLLCILPQYAYITWNIVVSLKHVSWQSLILQHCLHCWGLEAYSDCRTLWKML